MDSNMSAEALRQALLDEVWAGAASGLGDMLLDEEKIRRAGPEELEQMARQCGVK
nr:hypothetical protein [uncultured Oscillibacter sp.]